MACSISSLINEVLGSRQTHQGRMYDQNFGSGLDSAVLDSLNSLLQGPFKNGYMRAWRYCPEDNSGVSTINKDENIFKVCLDVQQFKPEELKVIVEDGFIVVEGKHEERSDEHGFVSRQFKRRYQIPDDVDEKSINSKLSSDGVLTLEVNKKISPNKSREIQITQTNEPVRIKPEEGKVKSDHGETSQSSS